MADTEALNFSSGYPQAESKGYGIYERTAEALRDIVKNPAG